jgi:hypothetical protein
MTKPLKQYVDPMWMGLGWFFGDLIKAQVTNDVINIVWEGTVDENFRCCSGLYIKHFLKYNND